MDISISQDPIPAGTEVIICYTNESYTGDNVVLTIHGDSPDDVQTLNIDKNPVTGKFCAPWTPPPGWVSIEITGPGTSSLSTFVTP